MRTYKSIFPGAPILLLLHLIRVGQLHIFLKQGARVRCLEKDRWNDERNRPKHPPSNTPVALRGKCEHQVMHLVWARLDIMPLSHTVFVSKSFNILYQWNTPIK